MPHRLAVVLIAMAALGSVPAVAFADGPGGPPPAADGPAANPEPPANPEFTVYGGCGLDEHATPARRCRKGDSLGAFFRSEARDAVYEVCVKFPTGRRLCASGQFAAQGVLYVNEITSNIEGPTTIVWTVDGQQIGKWTFDLLPKPIVPNFGISPLIVANTHRLFGLVIRNMRDGLRVRAWRRGCGCALPLRLISSSNRTRRYRITGPRANSTFSLGETLYVQVHAPGKRDHGARIWGRVYRGILIRDRRGGANDTAFSRVGNLLCTPPGTTYRAAVECSRVRS